MGGNRNETDQAVIASEAKQSRSNKRKLDCFIAKAPRGDEHLEIG
jgi:hypothetical protein